MRYCKVGDLAIVVTAFNQENIGKIVRIVATVGKRKWHDFDTPTWIWLVESEGSPLAYEWAAGDKTYHAKGKAPDAYLRPLKPVKVKEDELELVH